MLRAREADAQECERAGLLHRVYEPEDGGSRKRKTVLFVHGRAGDSGVMWIFSKAVQKARPLCVAPQAPLEDPIGGFSWWSLVHSADAESPSPTATSYQDLSDPLERLERFIEALPELYGADLNELYAVGFSQGAAMISTLCLRRPELFRGVALLCGFIPRAVLEQAKSQPPLALPDFFIAHGTEDKVVTVQKAEQARDALESLGSRVTYHTDAVAHKMGAAGIRALGDWFSERLPPENTPDS